MTAVRIVQGAIFGLAVSVSRAGEDASTASTFTSALLLVVGILLLVMAVKKLVTDEDPDAPPPVWLTRAASMPPRQAFLVGAGLLVIAPEFWVFTLSAIAAIGEAALTRPTGVAVYLGFVVLTALPLLSLIAVALASPARSDVVLMHASAWLTRHNRTLVIGVGLVFDTWFLAQALSGL